jgi:hypothetical protein
MTFSRELITLYAVLQDKKDQLHRALALFESGISYLDGSSPFNYGDHEGKEKALYLLDLYQVAVVQTLDELEKEISSLKKSLPNRE